MWSMRFLICLSLLALPVLSPALDTSLVRGTEPLTPEQERAALRVPEEFEVQLVAAEPEVNKPINMAFDAKGRLWVTSSYEYPYAAPKERWSDPQGTRVKDSCDAVLIFEDANGDGRADKRTVFADGLNIPTGVLPYGKGCYAWSIPNIWYFEDTDGDDVADKRSIVFGPLGYEKDVHGNCSSFRLGPDGWIYGTHGFSNTSRFVVRPENLKGAKPGDPGTVLEVNSGNVYRFRPDGSRIELFTGGQVNPFGLAWDSYGMLYSADCHSAPIYQLLHGAWYPSFGKPHDGIGFGPEMIRHDHSSTGICGIVALDGHNWGPEWEGRMLIGNVVTSRVNCDRLEWKGATPEAMEEKDFIESDDPWFRPVDLRLGPDGSLYVADFYNKVIGHYEVPLTHPGRDKERGRIWKIVRKQPVAAPSPSEGAKIAKRLWLMSEQPALSDADRAALRMQADSSDPRVRQAAVHVMQRHPAAEWLEILVRLVEQTPAEDTHLRHTVRLALRAQLRAPGVFATLQQMTLSPAVAADLASIARAVASPEAAAFLFQWIRKSPGSREEMVSAVQHIAANPGVVSAEEVAAFAREKLADDLMLQGAVVQALITGLEQQRRPVADGLAQWAAELSDKILNGIDLASATAWEEHAYPGAAASRSPWVLQERECSDGQKALFLSSLELGGEAPESRTGVVRSRTFPRPDKFSFWLCGHRGHPEQPAHERNYAALVDAATGQRLFTAWPPRNDVAQRTEWVIAPGGPVYLEIGDGDTGDAYAWLAVSRIEPLVVNVGDFGAKDTGDRALLAARLGRGGLSRAGWERLWQVLCTAPLTDKIRQELGNALPDTWRAEGTEPPAGQRAAMRVARRFLALPGLPVSLRRSFTTAGSTEAEKTVFVQFPWVWQVRWAELMCDSAGGAAALAELVKRGIAPARVLVAPAVAQKLAAQKVDVAALTKDLPPLNEATDRVIKARLEAWARNKPDAALGQPVFAAQCAICHKLGALGNLVGPQLDGIGNRGAERLCEDILDPNRNVDHAFQLRILKLKSGESRAGLVRSETAEQIVLVDVAAQETRVSKTDIAEDTATPLSLMPAIFGDALPEEDFLRLLAFLLEQRAK